MPESFAEQVQAPDVTSCGGSRVFHIGWQGCGSLSPETIKLSPLYFCSGTTEGVLSSPVALVMMRFEAGQPLCHVCNLNSRLYLQLLLSCGKCVHARCYGHTLLACFFCRCMFNTLRKLNYSCSKRGN